MLPDGRRSTGRARSRRRPDVRLYERQAAAATRGGWSVERDIRWRDIDRARARARPGILVGLRDAALIEAFHPVNLARLLRLMWDDVDGSAVFSLELYEGFKHFHALRLYLDAVGHEPASRTRRSWRCAGPAPRWMWRATA